MWLLLRRKRLWKRVLAFKTIGPGALFWSTLKIDEWASLTVDQWAEMKV